MSDSYIEYRSGYKYQLAADYVLETGIKPPAPVDDHRFIGLTSDGRLTVFEGYAWDGPSGPVIDTRKNMRASLVHDAFYQLIRMRYLTLENHKDVADRLFESLCIEDGVSPEIAHVYYVGLKYGGKPSADPKNKKIVRRAPKSV
jgi:hypothetical protein